MLSEGLEAAQSSERERRAAVLEELAMREWSGGSRSCATETAGENGRAGARPSREADVAADARDDLFNQLGTLALEARGHSTAAAKFIRKVERMRRRGPGVPAEWFSCDISSHFFHVKLR